MKSDEKWWKVIKTMKNYEKVMKNDEKLWKTMKNYKKVMKNDEKLWKMMKSYEKVQKGGEERGSEEENGRKLWADSSCATGRVWWA